ncbi:PspC domain-containing protein [Kineococcus sp. GCM10028916]|uniref:PspC domain-containing protein n=1 Tax=Kineococcus sp. GCM10028916 TaxID=3273394 RepID=UPI003644542A
MTSTTAPPEGPAPTGPVRDCRATFFRSVRGLGVVRGEDRWFAGVCGAVAARTGYDPLLVRGTVAALTAVGGLGLACYGLAWLLLPDARKAGRIEAEAVTRGDVSGAAWLAGALVVLDLFVPRALVGILTTGRAGPGWGFLITTLVALLGWWVLRDQRFTQFAPPRPRLSLVKTPKAPPSSAHRDQPEPPPAVEPGPVREPVAGFGSATERSAAARAEKHRLAQERAQERAAAAKARRRPGSPLLTTAVLGLALLAAGAVVVLGLLVDLPGRTVPLACCAAVAVMGFGAVLAGVRGRRTALVGLAWPAAFCAVATSLLPPATGWTWQVQKTWSPTGATALSSAVGQLSVDPSRLDGGPARATIAAGRLDVLVPDDATVLVEVRVLVGSVRWQDDADVVALDGTATQHSVDGADLRQVFAVGPDAAALADTLVVRGDDPAGWTVPAGTPELQAVAWTGEVRLAAAGSTLLEDR